MPNQDQHKLFMHMDKQLHNQIKAVAQKEHRSVSAQIHSMLEESLNTRQISVVKEYLNPLVFSQKELELLEHEITYNEYLNRRTETNSTLQNYNKLVDTLSDGYSEGLEAYLQGFAVEVKNMLDFLSDDERNLFKLIEVKTNAKTKMD